MATTIESPLKIRRRLRAAFSPAIAAKQLNELKVEARKSLLKLKGLSGKPPIQLVAFYVTVSPWCDRCAELYQLERALARIDYGQYDKARKTLIALAAQEVRYSSGVNRTRRGETPTAENIFLGNRCGLSTKTVDYWERKRGDYTTQPALIGRSDSPTIMGVIDAQASNLLAYELDQWTPLLQDLIDS
jgi:hypothetical protein